MSWREVTKDDVGKMVEVSDTNAFSTEVVRRLAFVREQSSKSRFTYFTFNDDNEDYITGWKNARIRTSPLPEGWLPDDWRVLGDDEVCNSHDLVVWEAMLESKFTLTEHRCYCDGEYTGKTAKFIVDGVDCNLCVIRPRYRPATKDDINKVGIGKYDDVALIKAIVERDNQGYDAWCLHKERGWCVARLSEMKVENEGWHVTK
jgi:hypothetical protein